MSSLRQATQLSLAAGLLSGWVAACGTDAIGVSECRQIEEARCSSGTACGFPNEDDCRRYYRNHCLHGVALAVVDASDVSDCVRDIERAGRCARDQGPDTLPASCAEPVALSGRAESVCDLVREPDRIQSCVFLGPEPPEPEPEPVVDGGGAG